MDEVKRSIEENKLQPNWMEWNEITRHKRKKNIKLKTKDKKVSEPTH